MDIKVKKNLWPKIKANLSLAKGSYAAVGFPGDSSKAKQYRDKGKTNIDIAVSSEFGTAPGGRPAIPAHPFLRQSFEGSKRRPFLDAVTRLLGMIAEFGTAPGVRPAIPARPFLRQSFEGSKRRPFLDAGTRLLGMIAVGQMSTKIALERLGTMGASAVKDEITAPSPAFVPNAPFTIRKKKSSHPLIDTGAMRAAVTYKVRMKSGTGSK